MKAESKRSVRTMLRWLLGVATVLMAALLIWQCVTIYHEGIAPENMGENGLRIHDIYSREIVTTHFASIAWSVWVFLALLAALLLAGCLSACGTNTPARASRSRRNRFARRWKISC